MKENYENWEKEVFEYLSQLKQEIDQNESAKSRYKGFKVWYSDFKKNPDILFIGINPGDGDPSNNRSINVAPDEEFAYLEYLNGENPSFTLARETVHVFENAGYSRDEIYALFSTGAAKINFHYIITTGESDIKKCFDALGTEKFKDFYRKSHDWTKRLIEIINPKVIICEGKNAFEGVVGEYPFWPDGCGLLKANEGALPILGYSRKYSQIANPAKLAELIKEHVAK